MKSNSFRAAKCSIGVFLTVIGLTYGLSVPLRSTGTAEASNAAVGEGSRGWSLDERAKRR